jgi:glycosyltransferase involved in cell wall biosynthesis
LKILQVSSLYPPHIGGIEHYVEALSNKLVNEGHEVTVYTSNVPKSKKYEIINGVEVYRFKSLFSPLNNQLIPGLFLKLISKNRFDVVHVHSHLHTSSNITVFSNSFRKRPIVLTSHGTVDYNGWKNIINVLYNKTMAKWMLKSVDKIIALSSKQADILENLGANSSTLCIIPHGIDLSQINLTIDTKKFENLYRVNDKSVILFVGGLIPRKGINYLIAAMKYVKLDSVLLIVGGELQGHPGVKGALEQQVKKLELENVLLLGRVSKEDLERAYAIADVFVLPSISEGLPLTLLEAMAYKKCVIATNIAGNADVIQNGKNGILFEARNSQELAEKIDYLLANVELRKKLGAEARKEIEKNYNWGAAFNRILAVYNRIQK